MRAIHRACAISVFAFLGGVGGAEASIRLIPGISQITIYESTPTIAGDPYVFAVPASGGAAAGFLGNFVSASAEQYSVFVTDASANADGDGDYITVKGRYDRSPTGGFNINGISYSIGATEVFANVVVGFTYGLNPVVGSEAFAVDGDANSFTTFGSTGGNSSQPDMSITVGWVPAPSALVLVTAGALCPVMRRRR